MGEPVILRGRTLLLVEFAPVRYNPARGEVEVVRSARIDIRLDGGDLDKSDALAWEKYSPTFERWFEANVTNYRPFNLTKGTSTQKYAEGILYIIGSSYISNTKLNNWIAQRQADGHKVVAVSTATTGTTDTAIRSYIQGQFASWTNPSLSYVVLVGDVADVATHNGVGGSGGGQATDLYYAAITPDPYTSDWSAPDLIVSRISVNNTTELERYIDRAVKYTTANFTDKAWMKKLSFPASSDNYSITEGTHNYVINTHTASRGYTGTFPTNPTAGGDKCYVQTYSLTAAQEAAAFNNGRVVINDSGHGAETYWADPSFTSTNLASVTHADAMPFVISNACVTGTYDYGSGDCWGEIWLAHSSGAILFWGASNNSYWTEDDILEKRMWDGIFACGITTLGDITHNAKMQTLAYFGANATMYYYFEMYNMLGDATIDLYTDAYYTLHATYPAEIMLGMNSVTFNVTDAKGVVANALVSLRGINVQQVGYTDASGNVTLVMDPSPNTVGTLNVAITAHNGKRHTGTINVIPASGPYLSYESHSLLLGGADPVTTPHPGYTYVMPVTLRNVGVAEAQNVTAVLSTTSPHITINDANSAYNNIASRRNRAVRRPRGLRRRLADARRHLRPVHPLLDDLEQDHRHRHLQHRGAPARPGLPVAHGGRFPGRMRHGRHPRRERDRHLHHHRPERRQLRRHQRPGLVSGAPVRSAGVRRAGRHPVRRHRHGDVHRHGHRRRRRHGLPRAGPRIGSVCGIRRGQHQHREQLHPDLQRGHRRRAVLRQHGGRRQRLDALRRPGRRRLGPGDHGFPFGHP